MAISNYGPLHVVNTNATGNQFEATAAGLASGLILITWYDSNLKEIRGRYYDALGNPLAGEDEVHVPTPVGATSTELPRVAAVADGGFTLGYSVASGVAVENVGFLIADHNGTPLAGTSTNFGSGIRA